jgi:hypothetical protein
MVFYGKTLQKAAARLTLEVHAEKFPLNQVRWSFQEIPEPPVPLTISSINLEKNQKYKLEKEYSYVNSRH